MSTSVKGVKQGVKRGSRSEARDDAPLRSVRVCGAELAVDQLLVVFAVLGEELVEEREELPAIEGARGVGVEEVEHLRLGAHLSAMLLEQAVILEELVEAHEAVAVEVSHCELLKKALDGGGTLGEALAQQRHQLILDELPVAVLRGERRADEQVCARV